VVESTQRLRVIVAMAEVMHDQGYVGTPVADVLKRAGVSRETFYQLFSSKLDCFLAAFDLVGDILLGQLGTVREGGTGSRLDRFERTIEEYLEVLASEPAYARLFLVEVYAAGPEAMQRRFGLQHRFADALGDLLGARSDSDRFACQTLVAAISVMVTEPLVAHDADALRQLGPPILDHVRRLTAGEGFFSG
jgi:AcrR family transcriptional regulator